MKIGTKLLLGWREWISLPALDIPFIKVKIDTGAKTSALHVYDLEIINIAGKEYAEFIICPIQRNNDIKRKCRAEIIDNRNIKSSNGHKERRYVIRSQIKIADKIWDIDITLTNRDIMHHRMLLGREAMGFMLVDPSQEFCHARPKKSEVLLSYC
jgi:ribosomal protein S6--L-glutamate ligase